ncbi:MAG TPA: hypothetical protein PKE40_00895 [Arachnia sp.]|nr:hypothetical protein [Arachnia sp.]HMT84883.1 hypothetical protein [Arachnia sp.]
MNDIHDLFHQAAPPEPLTQGWADEARSRRTRRLAGLGGLAALAVLAVAIPVGLHLFGDGPPLTLPPAETASAPDDTAPSPNDTAPSPNDTTDPEPVDYVVPGPSACTDQRGAMVQPGPGPVAPGATQAWLCGDAIVQDDYPSGQRGPLEPLTLNPDALIALYQAAPLADPDQACTAEYRLTYRLVFEYPDAPSQVVQGELHGCRTTTDGETVRDGGQELYDAAIAAWTEQRRGADPDAEPPHVDTSDCDIAGTLLPADLDELSVVLVCGADEVVVREVEDMSEIVDAVVAGGEPFPADYAWPAELTGRRVVLRDRFGDALVLMELREGEFELLHDGEFRLFRASPELIEGLRPAADE